MPDEIIVTDATKEEVTKTEEFIDPGQNEGLPKKDPRAEQNNLTPDHPRFQEVYKQMKELERQLNERKGSEKDTASLIEALKEHNRQLAASITTSMDNLTEAVTASDADESSQIEAKIAELKAQKAAALEDMDYAKADTLSEAIFDLKLELKEKKAEVKAPVTKGAGGEVNEIPPVFKQWIEDNAAWYKGDPIARGAAISIDAVLSVDPVWGKKPVEERLAEVKAQVLKRFPEHQKKTETKPGGVDTSSVENPSSNKGASGLTDAERQLAANFGIPEVEYAKQLAAIRAAKRR